MVSLREGLEATLDDDDLLVFLVTCFVFGLIDEGGLCIVSGRDGPLTLRLDWLA